MQYRTNLRNAVIQQTQTALSAYPICYPNQKGFSAPSNTTWTCISILMPKRPFSISMSRTDRTDFILQVDIYIPKGKGDLDAYTVADILDLSFPIDGTPITYNSQDVFVKYISSPRHANIGSNDDDAWDKYIIDVGLYAFVDRS